MPPLVEIDEPESITTLPVPLPLLPDLNTVLIVLLPLPVRPILDEVSKIILLFACRVKVAAVASVLRMSLETVILPLPPATRVTSPVAVMPAIPLAFIMEIDSG